MFLSFSLMGQKGYEEILVKNVSTPKSMAKLIFRLSEYT